MDEQDRDDYSDYDEPPPTTGRSPPVVLPTLAAVAVALALVGVSILVVALVRA